MINIGSNAKKWSILSKLTLLNIIVFLSGVIGIIGAFQINQGAKLHELNIQHLTHIQNFLVELNGFNEEGANDLNNFRKHILEIREQSISCINLAGWIEKQSMKLAGTYQAVNLCEKDIKIADKALDAINRFENKSASQQSLLKSLNIALAGFQKSSKEFQPQVAQTVSFMFGITIVIFIAKALILVLGGYFVSISVVAEYKKLENTLAAKEKAEESNIKLQTLSKELAESKQKYQDLYENTPQMQLSVDIESALIAYCNNTVVKETGYSKSEIIGRKIYEMYHPDSLEKAKEYFKEVRETGETHDKELQIKRKDGSKIDVLLDVSSSMGADGRKYTQSVWTDITELKRAEILLQSAKEESEKANIRLKELDLLKNMFIASMSHELRTPLNSIIGFNSLVLQEKLGPLSLKQKDYLGRVYQSSLHLMTLINDIIDISKIEAGELDISLKNFLLKEIVEDALGQIQAKIDEKGLAVRVDVPPDLQVITDEKRVKQCILNYLSNAAKYTQAGSICLSAREFDGQVEIVIEDTGIGIKEKDLPKMFKQFQRLDSALGIKEGGTGLGLYLTQKIAVEVLGGSVAVESQLGTGSRFFLRFPKDLRTKEVDLFNAPALKDQAVSNYLKPGNRFKTVLIIEDNDDNMKLIQFLLDRDNYKTFTADTGREGLKIAVEEKPDFILLDIQLPDIDGTEILKQIRASEIHTKVPIIAMTAHALSGDREKLIRAGCNGYIEKPLDPEKVLPQIKEILDSVS
jgi:PAS domain S-box-containing protein